MKYKHLGLIVFMVLLNVFGGTWRYVPKYYKSMAYVSCVNACYYLLCRRHLVWEFTPNGINWKFLRAAQILIVSPLLVLLYLSKLPESRLKQILHTVKSILIACLVELFVHKQKLLQFRHGWNLLWSSLMYLMMFTYSSLFTKRPFLTCLLSILSSVFFIIKFNVPLTTKHSCSRRFEPLTDLFYHSFLEDVF
jgi:hypothetical protein